jgi:hypothetical protein
LQASQGLWELESSLGMEVEVRMSVGRNSILQLPSLIDEVWSVFNDFHHLGFSTNRFRNMRSTLSSIQLRRQATSLRAVLEFETASFISYTRRSLCKNVGA